MQAQATSVSDFLGQIDPDAPETAPIRERLTEEAEQLQRLATGAQERDRILAMKSMAEDITLTSRGRDDKERRMRNRSTRDFLGRRRGTMWQRRFELAVELSRRTVDRRVHSSPLA